MTGQTLWRTLRSPVVVCSSAAVLVTTAVLAVTALAGWSARVAFVLGVALVVAFALAALQQLGESLDTTARPRRRRDDAERSDAEFTEDRVIFLETRLKLSTKDARVFKTRVQPLLGEIVHHQLLRHHGIDAERCADLARETAGEPLWRLVTEEREEPVTHQELVEAVNQIERLSARG